MIDAASLGGFYALAALGVGLIFGIMRLINFAYGDYVTWAAYALVVPSSAQVATKFIGDWPAPIMIVTIVLIVIALSLATERFVFKPMRESSPETLLTASFAVSYLLQNVILFVHSGRPKSVNIWSDLSQSLSIQGYKIPLLDVVTIVVCITLLLALVFFLKKTDFGVQMRAAAEDFRMARFLGVRANTIIAIAFAISGLLAAVVSLLLVAKTGVLDYRLGQPVVLVAFVATVVGGMGSVLGAVIGEFVIGFMSTVLQSVLPIELREARDAFVFGLVLLILIFRPQGIMQVHAMRERV